MIGERLQELRKDKGISQAEIAKILGVSHYTISSYECNRSDPDDKSKIILARLFDVSLDYLLGLIDEPLSFNRNENTIIIPKSLNEDDKLNVSEYIKFLEFKKTNNTKKMNTKY